MKIYGNSVGHPLPDPRKGMTMSGPINMNGQVLKGLNAPTADDEAVNKGYVDEAKNKAKNYTDIKSAPYNHVDNGDFSQFVAQTGIGGSHGTQAYAGDRWILDSGTVSGEANETGNGYKNITLNGTIRQKIANPPAVGTAGVEMISGTAAVTYENGEVTVTSNGGVIGFVKLFEGEYTADNMPKAQHKGYGVEMAECMRYFQKNSIMFVASNAWDTVYSIYHFAPAMRIRPTVKSFGRATGTPDVYDYWDASTNSYKSITGVGVNVAAGYVKFTNANGLFEVGMLYEVAFEASADL